MAKSSKLVTIEKDERVVLEIAERTKDDLVENYRIKVSSAVPIPTIAYVFLREMISYIGENSIEDLNFLELFYMGIDPDEDKLISYPGPNMKLDIKGDNKTEE